MNNQNNQKKELNEPINNIIDEQPEQPNGEPQTNIIDEQQEQPEQLLPAVPG